MVSQCWFWHSKRHPSALPEDRSSSTIRNEPYPDETRLQNKIELATWSYCLLCLLENKWVRELVTWSSTWSGWTGRCNFNRQVSYDNYSFSKIYIEIHPLIHPFDSISSLRRKSPLEILGLASEFTSNGVKMYEKRNASYFVWGPKSHILITLSKRLLQSHGFLYYE
jgi:hypothetical protein